MNEPLTAFPENTNFPSSSDLEQSFYHMLMQAPVAMVVFRGADYIIEFANEQYFSLIGKTAAELLKQPAFTAMPQAVSQGVPAILDMVRSTGEPFRLNEFSTLIDRKGHTERVYLNIVHQPLKAADGSVEKVMVMLSDVTEQVVARQKKEEETALLQKTQDQLSLSISAGNIGTWHWDKKNNKLTWSKEQCRLYGLEQEEFSGKGEDFIAFVLPEDLPVIQAQGEFNNQRPGDYEYQFRIRRKDGEIRWLQARSRTFHNEDGELLSLTGVNIDITKQKSAEEKLRQSEQRFGAAVAAVQGILWTNNANGEMEGEQPGWEALTGQRYEAYQGYGWVSAIHPDDAQPTVEAWKEALRETKTFVFEHRLRRKDGSWGRYSIRAVPILEDDGTIREWVGVHTDITEQRKAEESLLESEQRFRTLAESLPQLVWMTDEKGKNEYASRQWQEYAGLDPAGRQNWEQIVHPDDMAPMTEQWQRSLQTGDVYRAEARLKNRSGDYRWHYVQGEALLNDEGRIVKWIGAFTDIHDQKTLAQKLEKLVAERTRELQRSNEDLLQFAHVASHDLKEPVRKILTFGSRLSDEFGYLLPPSATLYLGKMESAANRMYAMIEGVLTYSSLNTVQQPSEPTDLEKLLQNVESDLEILIREKEAALVYGSLPVVSGAPVLLYQLFYNLVNNSLKFAREQVKPRIVISAHPVAKTGAVAKGLDAARTYVSITLQDNGIGFDQRDAGRLFYTFSRLNPKEKYEGTGLGLALCKKIVERHHGWIGAEGKEGKGALFTVILPVEQPKATV